MKMYKYKRIAVKIGSNVLTTSTGILDTERMQQLVEQVSELHKNGVEIILISSGAVASGRSEITPRKKRTERTKRPDTPTTNRPPKQKQPVAF